MPGTIRARTAAGSGADRLDARDVVERPVGVGRLRHLTVARAVAERDPPLAGRPAGFAVLTVGLAVVLELRTELRRLVERKRENAAEPEARSLWSHL